MKPSVLIVDDDPDFSASLQALVEREGFQAEVADSLERARASLSRATPDALLVDLALPDGSGSELLADEELAASTEIVVITGRASVDSAVEALRQGARDYLTKPVDRTRLGTILAGIARTRDLRQEVDALRRELRELGRFGPMVGRSKPMQDVYDLVSRVAPTDATVLLIGESGTGKELAAETIHRLSGRRSRPFLAVNCGAVSPNLIESELFGHERGSFTGADRRRIGLFERADGGTLLLDEITEMSPDLQVKLLRVLESRSILRVGATDPIAVDVRIVAATNRSPDEAVRKGELREDLFYRLNVFPIALPPLRQRNGDVELLAQHFLDQLNAKHELQKDWTREALEHLRSRAWPGNVRELRNAVERAYILGDEEIGVESFRQLSLPSAGAERGLRISPGISVAEMERRLILETLEACGGNKKQAAQMLGISLKTLYNRLNVYRAAGG